MTGQELLARLNSLPLGTMVIAPVRGSLNGQRPTRVSIDQLMSESQLSGSDAEAGATGQAAVAGPSDQAPAATTAAPALPQATVEERRAICEDCDQWNDTFRSCRLGYPDVPDSTQRCIPCSWSKPDARCLAETPQW
jgi:hypothetical protein